MCTQEAVDKLERETGPAHQQKVTRLLPWVQSCLVWPTWRRPTAPYTVHEVPNVLWHCTSSSGDTSEGAPDEWSDLVDAALVLLQNTSLNETATHTDQQQQRQRISEGPVVHLGQPQPTCILPAMRNWDAFVQQCLASKPSAATAVELVDKQDAAASSFGTGLFQSQVRLVIACAITV